MAQIDTYLRYLAIPAHYGPEDRLQWSHSGEAIESRSGQTFVFTSMLAAFLEGFAAQRPLIHFAHILDLIRLLVQGQEMLKGISVAKSLMLRETFRTCETPSRNAGVFFGVVCEGIPSAFLHGHDDHELVRWLATAPNLWMLQPQQSETPSPDAAEFRKLLHERLGAYKSEDFRHWFRFGRARLPKEGERLVENVIEVKPPIFHGTLDDLIRERPRLAGALPLVSKMLSALALPPRRRTPPELPLGGYADVTNRGEPERLLPTQFALEGDEFVRRFAEKELLFFRREESHQHTREQLILLVDQGVRTWGVVRIALTAAVLAFRQIAERKKRSFLIRFSGTDRINPAECDLLTLADQLETSDLTANPADLLAAEGDAEINADVVLLTHPRSLMDHPLKQTAQALPRKKGLFALTVDEEGTAQFSEIRHGEPVPLSRFRLDFHSTEAPRIERTGDSSQWTGDVETVPYPFPVSPFQRLVALDFDSHSRHLLVLTHHGYLHLWDLETGRLEMLPRAFDQISVFDLADRVLGVRGGFVVAGKLGNNFAVAHYDLAPRNVKLHVMGPPGSGSVTWLAFPDIHAVAVRQVALCRGLDLSTGAMYAEPEPVKAGSAQAHAAYLRALLTSTPPPWIFTGATPPNTESKEPHLTVDGEAGQICLNYGGSERTFRIIEDGHPVPLLIRSYCAQVAGDVLAFAACRESDHTKLTWWLFSNTSKYSLLSTFDVNGPAADLCRLSPDGRAFALPKGHGQITVKAVGEAGANRLVTAPARIHNNLRVELFPAGMHLVIGQKQHVLSWEHGALTHYFEMVSKHQKRHVQSWEHGALTHYAEKVLKQTPEAAKNRVLREVQHPLANVAGKRFVSVVRGAVDALIDLLGNIVIYDPHRNRLVCVFRIHRSQFAAWMPEGFVYGPSEMTGRNATPDALQLLGSALRQASSPVEA